jgi:hypothetical protein
MADRVLLISWSTTVRGREERALEVFNETMGMYGRMQQDGRIESFDVVLLTPNGGMDGYIEIHGSAQQLAALREDEEFQRGMVDAELVIEDMRVVDGWTNAGIAKQMAIYQEAVAKVPQRA